MLADGSSLPEVEVAFETYGTLNADGSNAVFVCHALTGDAHAADWWATMIGPGRPVDTDRFFVISPNLLGGCSGTTGPRSIDPSTGERYGLDFPQLTMGDLVAVHRRLAAHLGVRRLHAAIGGSLGGMQVLQWAIDAPEEIERAVVVAASSRLTAMNIGFSAVARAAITGDPDFAQGRYDEGAGPRLGMAVARMMAHLTYMSEQGLEDRFGRRPQGEALGNAGFGVDFAIESYLDHQGSVFLERFDALSYLYFTRVMDYFDPFADPEAAARVAAGGTRFLVVSFDSDWRFGTEHSVRLADELRAGGVEVERHELSASWGHDSFLMEAAGYQDLVTAFLGS
ncbi:homoserine O-acetyltransferase [Myroides odoratimimus subsp. xuanwuensis]